MSPLRGRFRLRAMAATAVVGVVSLLGSGSAGAAPTYVNRVSGNAFGLRLQGTVLVVPVNVPPQPNASLNETTRTNSNQSASDSDMLASLSVPNVLTASVLEVQTTGTTGFGGSSESSADVATLRGLVNADVVHAECRADANGFTASSSLANLGLNVPLVSNPLGGLPLFGGGLVSPTDTATLNLLGLQLTLNEVVNGSNDPTKVKPENQTANRTRYTGHVNALHLKSTGILGNFDLVVAHAHCDVINRNGPPMP